MNPSTSRIKVNRIFGNPERNLFLNQSKIRSKWLTLLRSEVRNLNSREMIRDKWNTVCVWNRWTTVAQYKSADYNAVDRWMGNKYSTELSHSGVHRAALLCWMVVNGADNHSNRNAQCNQRVKHSDQHSQSTVLHKQHFYIFNLSVHTQVLLTRPKLRTISVSTRYNQNNVKSSFDFSCFQDEMFLNVYF